MKTLLLIFFLLSFSAQAKLADNYFYTNYSAKTSSGFKIEGFGKTYAEGYFIDHQGSFERFSRIKLTGKLNIQFHPLVFAHFEPYLEISESENQNKLINKISNLLKLQELFLDIKPVENISLHIGYIDQDYLQSPLLISDQNFVSLLLVYLSTKKNYEWQVILHQSIIPNESFLKEAFHIKKSSYVTFLFLYSKWTPSPYYSFDSHLTSFYFTTFPNFSAKKSKSISNTVTHKNTYFRLAYPYYGVDWGFRSQFKGIPQIPVSLAYNILINLGAPLDKSLGSRIYGTLDFAFWKNIKIYSHFEYFYNKSDSSPSFYNNVLYGYNNRQGFLISLSTYFPKPDFDLGVIYSINKPIHISLETSGLKKQQQSIVIYMSTRY